MQTEWTIFKHWVAIAVDEYKKLKNTNIQPSMKWVKREILTDPTLRMFPNIIKLPLYYRLLVLDVREGLVLRKQSKQYRGIEQKIPH